jgi:hypothetical protein
MAKVSILSFCFILFLSLVIPAVIWSQKADSTIVDFKIQALYRSAMLTWKTKDDLKNPVAVQILRADTFEDGPYQEVETISLTPGKKTYEYVDKSMGAESKYYYKLMIKETNESFGPLPTRPFFSPPATQLLPPLQSWSSS